MIKIILHIINSLYQIIVYQHYLTKNLNFILSFHIFHTLILGQFTKFILFYFFTKVVPLDSTSLTSSLVGDKPKLAILAFISLKAAKDRPSILLISK